MITGPIYLMKVLIDYIDNKDIMNKTLEVVASSSSDSASFITNLSNHIEYQTQFLSLIKKFFREAKIKVKPSLKADLIKMLEDPAQTRIKNVLQDFVLKKSENDDKIETLSRCFTNNLNSNILLVTASVLGFIIVGLGLLKLFNSSKVKKEVDQNADHQCLLSVIFADFSRLFPTVPREQVDIFYKTVLRNVTQLQNDNA